MDETTIDQLTTFVEGEIGGPEWEAWSAANPELAREVLIARRVRVLVSRMQAAEMAVPVGFEARLMARIREDATLLDLLELWFNGVGRLLVDLLNVIFDLLPDGTATPRPMAA